MPSRVLSGPSSEVARQLILFGAVGVVGFLADALALLAFMGIGFGPYFGRLCSYLTAASTTWVCNRSITFKDHRRGAAPVSLWREWILYVTSQLSGASINLGLYSALTFFSPFFARHPVYGVALGSIAGLGANFLVARRFVFRKAASPEHTSLPHS